MYEHPTTVNNLNKLKSFGNILIAAEDGELASGLHGTGRLAEPEHLLEHVKNHFTINVKLQGKKVLITSGPTFEAIDPVRFIGNHSSGKMGSAMADAFVEKGYKVISNGTDNHSMLIDMRSKSILWLSVPFEIT